MFRTSSVHHQERFVQAVIAVLVCAVIQNHSYKPTLYYSTYQNLRIQLVQNAPDDGPVRSETCRANISAE